MKKRFSRIVKSNKVKKILFFLRENKRTVITLFVATIVADILLIKPSHDIFIFSWILLYVLCGKLFQLTSRHTFLLCFFLLCIMAVSYLRTGPSVATEKAGVWFVLFLVIGVIQQLKE